MGLPPAINDTRRGPIPSGFRGGTVQEMAARLGVEPRQNESESFVLPLHHQAVKSWEIWSRRWDSNPQPPVYKTGALPLSYASPRGSVRSRLPRRAFAPTGKRGRRVLPQGAFRKQDLAQASESWQSHKRSGHAGRTTPLDRPAEGARSYRDAPEVSSSRGR